MIGGERMADKTLILTDDEFDLLKKISSPMAYGDYFSTVRGRERTLLEIRRKMCEAEGKPWPPSLR
jgi:hypothetical protein